MLVKLYELEDDWGFRAQQETLGITIRKPMGPEKHLVVEWVTEVFGDSWGSEVDMAMTNRPMSCFLALRDDAIVGFACYDATALGCFGPIGVKEACQGRKTGKALLLACLLDMKQNGYRYAVIGAVGEPVFFKKTVAALEIPDSTPGLLSGWLRADRGHKPLCCINNITKGFQKQ
jgi:hypothetical protein